MSNLLSNIVFICVNHNGYEETVKYIRSVLSLKTNKILSIIIVENSEHNNDFNKLNNFVSTNKLESNIRIVKTKNEGYFQGLNKGIELSKEMKLNPLFYIIGNNDITFKEDFIFQLCKIELKENELILVPDITTNDGSHENPQLKYRISKFKKISFDIYYSNYYIAKLINLFYKTKDRKFKVFDPKRQQVYQGIGAIYILTQDFFTFFDRLWEKVFLYCEETILAAQIRSVNGKIIYEPSLKCFHNESSSTSKLKSREKYEIYRESYRIARKYM